MPKLTEEQKSQIVDRVAHQGDGMGWAMETFDLELEEVEELMVDANYERCPECEWFKECGELVDAEGEPRACSECDHTPIGED